jgi:hypothetical protein
MGKAKRKNLLATVSSMDNSSLAELPCREMPHQNQEGDYEIDVAKVGERIERFSVWVDVETCSVLLSDSDKNDCSYLPAVKLPYGRCHIVAGPNQKQVLGNRVKFCGWVVWEPVGDNSPGASEKMKLARFISELPSCSFIQELKTLDQLIHWVMVKDYCILLAKLFIAGCGAVPDNPLQPIIDSGEISLRYYNTMVLSSDLYRNLWELIVFKQRSIKAQFVHQEWGFPFKPYRLLMEEIIRADVDGEFANVLKQRYVDKAQDHRIIAELGKKNLNGTLSCKERDSLSNLTARHSQPNEWLNRLIAVAESLSHDRVIRTKLDIYNKIMNAIASRQVQEAKRPELRTAQEGPSSTWIDGTKFSGIQPNWKNCYKS